MCLALTGGFDSAGSTVRVASGGDLQAALEKAKPGDTILLARDGRYAGNFVLPARHAAAGQTGEDDRVITVRTEGDGWPREGERMTPAAAEHLAALQSPNASPALSTAPAARGWRITLVEIQATRDAGGTIVALGDASEKQAALASVPSIVFRAATGTTLHRLLGAPRPRARRRGFRSRFCAISPSWP